ARNHESTPRRRGCRRACSIQHPPALNTEHLSRRCPMSESHSTNGADTRVGTYLRKSTDEQEQSIGRQRSQVAAYAAARRYRVVAEYVDEGVAGDVFGRRSGFQKLLAAAARHEFDVILVDEPSRLSRQNPIELIETVIAPLRRADVKIDTVSKG